MLMKKSKIIIVSSIIISSVLLLLLIVLAGPFISLYGIQSNLDGKETEKLQRYIDFPVLQENLKVKIKNQTQDALGFEFSNSDNVLAKFAMQFANQIIDVAVDNAISPGGIAMMLSGNDLSEIISGKDESQKNKSPKQTTKSIVEVFQESHFEYSDKNTFIFYLPNKEKSNKQAGKLIFLRNGLRWKLSNIEFSE